MKFLCIFVPRKKPQKKSLYEPIGTDREGNEIKLYDIIETDEEVAEKFTLKENIQTLYEKVERIIAAGTYYFKMRYGLYNEEEYTQREIARQLGISVLISRIEKGLWRNYGNLFHDFKIPIYM